MEAFDVARTIGVNPSTYESDNGREDTGGAVEGAEHAALFLTAAGVADGLDQRRPLNRVRGNGEQRPDELCRAVGSMEGKVGVQAAHHDQRKEQELLWRPAVREHPAGDIESHADRGKDGHEQAEFVVAGLGGFAEHVVKLDLHIRQSHGRREGDAEREQAHVLEEIRHDGLLNGLGAVYGLAADDGLHNLHVQQVVRGRFQRILGQDDEVGEVAFADTPLHRFTKHRMRGVYGPCTQGVVNGNTLIFAEDLPALGAAGRSRRTC